MVKLWDGGEDRQNGKQSGRQHLVNTRRNPTDALINNTCNPLSGTCRGLLRLHGSRAGGTPFTRIYGWGLLSLHGTRAGDYSAYTELGPGTTLFTWLLYRGVLRTHGSEAGEYSVYTVLQLMSWFIGSQFDTKLITEVVPFTVLSGGAFYDILPSAC